jgi:hypothetical protein
MAQLKIGENARSTGVALRLFLALSLVFSPFPFSFSPIPLAFGEHPFITDDAGTQGAGNWQLELLAQRDRHVHAANAGTGPARQSGRSTQFNPVLTYGLRDNLDIALGLNYLRHRDSETGAPTTVPASGATDSTLELKWRFHDEDGFSLALKPGVTLPTGDENRGLGAGRTSWGIDFIATYEAGPWTLLGNVSYFRPRFKLPQDAADNRDNLWRVSGGTVYGLRSDVKLTGELGVRTNEARNDPFLPGQYARFVMLGAIYSPTDKIDLDIGVRKGLNHAETDTVFLLGATFRW